jgi:hypothetical protein
LRTDRALGTVGTCGSRRADWTARRTDGTD